MAATSYSIQPQETIKSAASMIGASIPRGGSGSAALAPTGPGRIPSSGGIAGWIIVVTSSLRVGPSWITFSTQRPSAESSLAFDQVYLAGVIVSLYETVS